MCLCYVSVCVEVKFIFYVKFAVFMIRVFIYFETFNCSGFNFYIVLIEKIGWKLYVKVK